MRKTTGKFPEAIKSTGTGGEEFEFLLQNGNIKGKPSYLLMKATKDSILELPKEEAPMRPLPVYIKLISTCINTGSIVTI